MKNHHSNTTMPRPITSKNPDRSSYTKTNALQRLLSARLLQIANCTSTLNQLQQLNDGNNTNTAATNQTRSRLFFLLQNTAGICSSLAQIHKTAGNPKHALKLRKKELHLEKQSLYLLQQHQQQQQLLSDDNDDNHRHRHHHNTRIDSPTKTLHALSSQNSLFNNAASNIHAQVNRLQTSLASIGELFQESGQLSRALKYFTQAYSLALQNQQQLKPRIFACLNLTSLFTAMRESSKAINIADEMIYLINEYSNSTEAIMDEKDADDEYYEEDSLIRNMDLDDEYCESDEDENDTVVEMYPSFVEDEDTYVADDTIISDCATTSPTSTPTNAINIKSHQQIASTMPRNGRRRANSASLLSASELCAEKIEKLQYDAHVYKGINYANVDNHVCAIREFQVAATTTIHNSKSHLFPQYEVLQLISTSYSLLAQSQTSSNPEAEQKYIEKAYRYSAKAIPMASFHSNWEVLKECYIVLVYYFELVGDSSQIITTQEKLVQIDELLGDTNEIAVGYCDLGDMYKQVNNFLKASQCYERVMQLSKTDDVGLHELYLDAQRQLSEIASQQ